MLTAAIIALVAGGFIAAAPTPLDFPTCDGTGRFGHFLKADQDADVEAGRIEIRMTEAGRCVVLRYNADEKREYHSITIVE
jgi:hypothetical protein